MKNKLSRAQLETELSETKSRESVLTMALSDVLGKNPVTWFCAQNSADESCLKFGVSRELGAMGGIVIIHQDGMATAFYFEEWFQIWRNADGDTEQQRIYRDLAHRVANHVRFVQDKRNAAIVGGAS
jgi:hypothetical protein